jgi:ABC-type branched-subunit amino acid transport system ATPase component/predicted MFS family arabinose efflux permease
MEPAAPLSREADAPSVGTFAAMTAGVLDAEAERHAEQERRREVLFADDLLPGVGAEPMSLKQGLRFGGAFTFWVLLALNSLDELENAALTVLAPDIRDTFGVSDGAVTFLAGASSAFLILGAFPMGYLADRFRRNRIVGISSLIFGVMVFMSGLAVNMFTLFVARLGVGVSKANTGPVHGSILADAYPIGVRGRISAASMAAGSLLRILSPVIVGGIAYVVGGSQGWRWAYFILGIPVFVLAVMAFRMPEPRRGQQEMTSVLGDVLDDDLPREAISIEAAFARLKQIRTFKTVMLGFMALGFSIFTGGILSSLYVEDRFGLDTLERGVLATVTGIGPALLVPFVARRFDQNFRRDPTSAVRMIGFLIMPVSILLPIQYAMPNAIAFGIAGIPTGILLMLAFTMIGPVTMAIVPYRLRGMGGAITSLYIFFGGATIGALVAALLVDITGPRPAVLILGIPSIGIGGFMMLRSSNYIRHDLSLVVSELKEELAEQERRAAAPAELPAIQISNIDFSYGQVQVLFDVGFEVRSGEVLALLGTNGAGKSTILRVIAGLGTPSRGVVRLHGETITLVAPERRVHMGVQMLPGGKGVFPDMTVAENLEMGAFAYRSDPDDVRHRIDHVLDLFVDLRQRQDQLAGSMSGGQQQMLALAMTLLHRPRVLLIDELSLGLAPVVVQDLLQIVERLKQDGMTIVVVEQSLNIALQLSDRAVFLEKGQVRFEGPSHELAKRDDLVRAVFLGHEGG